MGIGNDGLDRWEYRVLISEHNEKCHKQIDPETAECGFTPIEYTADIIDTREDHNLCGLCF